MTPRARPKLPLFAALLLTGALCPDLRALEEQEYIYLEAPVYNRTMNLVDGLAMAELVVTGTPVREPGSSGRLKIDTIHFGKVHADAGDDSGFLDLAHFARVTLGKPGIWMLVRTRSGYLSVNPTMEPLRLDEYQKLERPEPHWTEAGGLTAHQPGSQQLYHTRQKAKGAKSSLAIRHGLDSYGDKKEMTVRLYLDGSRALWIRWDSSGNIDTVSRFPVKGHGFFLDLAKGQIESFRHFKDRRVHGLERIYYYCRGQKDSPRQESHFTNGVIDGTRREWDEEGKLVREVDYERGLIPPVVQYAGKGDSDILMHRSERGVSYSGSFVAAKITSGMTTRQVSELLKVDFSPTSGIHFPTWQPDIYLHIAFKDGKVSALTSGHNGVCLSPQRELRAPRRAE